MKIKCINDCDGDFWDITIGKTYNVIKTKNMLLYIDVNGIEHKEERYLIKDDVNEEYLYPTACFEIIN